MKKILSAMLVLSMILSNSAALAMDMGVQIISGPELKTEPVSLDNLEIEKEAEIEEYAIVKPLRFEWKNTLAYINPGVVQGSLDSGSDAEYACLVMDITNTQFSGRNFLTNCAVKVVFDGIYEYDGWFYQYEKDSSKVLTDSNDWFTIQPLYAGHYVFGCTLPNFVVNSDKPLAMVITIDENELTYDIRQGNSSMVTSADMGIQIIGSPEIQEEAVSLDDLKIEKEAVIEECALVRPLRFEWKDKLVYINPGVVQGEYSSGSDAQYACLITDITNTQLISKNFLTNCSVKVVYDDRYEYAGWCYQYQKETTKVLNDSNDCFSIAPLFVGHYVFGSTLPNLVVESDNPLRVEINIDGNEIIYHIRK